MKGRISDSLPWLPYVAPFGVFMLWTEFGGRFAPSAIWVYPAKTCVVGALLFLFRDHYRADLRSRSPLLALIVGSAVFVLWVLPEGLYPQLTHSSAFDPFALDRPLVRVTWIGFRILGAVLVVPIMEELFWRSFLLRFLIDTDFRSVPIGRFSWWSFAATSLLFGVEHHRWLVGMLAGVVYNLLLYRTRSLTACIIAHATTNLLLALYVLTTQQWSYW